MKAISISAVKHPSIAIMRAAIDVKLGKPHVTILARSANQCLGTSAAYVRL
jgi:hypothetical protein